PVLVPQGYVRPHLRGRQDEQLRPLPDLVATDRWSLGCNRVSLFPSTPRPGGAHGREHSRAAIYPNKEPQVGRGRCVAPTPHHHSDVPDFAGRGGVPPPGGNNGLHQYYTCMSGATSGTADLAAATTACGGAGSVWFPDLRRSEAKLSLGVMVKF